MDLVTGVTAMYAVHPQNVIQSTERPVVPMHEPSRFSPVGSADRLQELLLVNSVIDDYCQSVNSCKTQSFRFGAALLIALTIITGVTLLTTLIVHPTASDPMPAIVIWATIASILAVGLIPVFKADVGRSGSELAPRQLVSILTRCTAISDVYRSTLLQGIADGSRLTFDGLRHILPLEAPCRSEPSPATDILRKAA